MLLGEIFDGKVGRSGGIVGMLREAGRGSRACLFLGGVA